MNPTRVPILVMVAAAVAAMPLTLNAQTSVGTAFTYQGQLKSSGVPVTDTCEFEFSLWDDQSAGSLIGTNGASGVAVTDGLFTVQLDFGPTAFNGAARWLEINVKGSGDPGFTTLSPRQAMTPTPYALNALSTAGVFNIMSFGATPNDETDDTAAIEAARDAAVAAGGGVVLVPPGEFHCFEVEIKSGVSFVGRGRYASFLVNCGTSRDHDTLTTTTDTEPTYHATIRDLGFRFMAGRTQGYAMKFVGFRESTIDGFFIEAPPSMDEAGGIYFWPGQPEYDTENSFNRIAGGKIYINRVGIKLEGDSYQPVNQNRFTDITTYSRNSNFIELTFANHNLFDRINVENSPPNFNPTFGYSLIDMDSCKLNVIRGCLWDLKGYGFAIIRMYGQNETTHVSYGNIIEANSLTHSGGYGIYIGDHTSKNIIRHNSIQYSAAYDIYVKPGGLALHNEIYDNRFVNGEVGHISAGPDTKTLQMWYSEEKSHVNISRDVRLTPTDTPGSCDAGKQGSMFYSSRYNELCFCNGTEWRQVDSGDLCGICGDGVTTGPPEETCDDGGESSTCDADCTFSECGDGVLNITAGEECDDGDTDNGDGCDENCEVEDYWECSPDSPSTCGGICGDGEIRGLEQCDDGNTDWNDGCGATCFNEGCGDGFVQQGLGEDCDPGSKCDDTSICFPPGSTCESDGSTCTFQSSPSCDTSCHEP